MTIDDLVALYESHSTFHKLDPKSHAMRVVVRALRDEMTKLGALEFQDSWTVLRKFDEILGDAGDEVAGGPRPEAMGGTPPATEPAPAVCEWTRKPYTALYSSCCDADYLRNVTDSGMCNRCGRPIKFTEAKE